MAETVLFKKLLIKPGMQIAIFNAPAAYEALLSEMPENITVVNQGAANLDLVHLFVNTESDLRKFTEQALSSLKYDGIFWISYPKKSSKIKTDIDRDHGWETLFKKGYRPVSAVSINETWSALRFRQRVLVGKQPKIKD